MRVYHITTVYIHICIFLSIYLFICLSTYLSSICLPASHLPTYLPIYPSTFISPIYPPFCLSSIYISVCGFTEICMGASIHLQAMRSSIYVRPHVQPRMLSHKHFEIPSSLSLQNLKWPGIWGSDIAWVHGNEDVEPAGLERKETSGFGSIYSSCGTQALDPWLSRRRGRHVWSWISPHVWWAAQISNFSL